MTSVGPRDLEGGVAPFGQSIRRRLPPTLIDSGPDETPVVVLIAEDPRTSHRAFEAMRIAVGIVAGENKVVVVLTGPAVHLLDADTDELVDGDDIAKFRASLRKLGVPFHVEVSSKPLEPHWNEEGHEVVAVTREQIAGVLRGARRSLIF